MFNVIISQTISSMFQSHAGILGYEVCGESSSGIDFIFYSAAASTLTNQQTESAFMYVDFQTKIGGFQCIHSET